MIDVLDMGTHFEMIDTDTNKRVSIQFGEFSVLIANIDHRMILNHLQRKFFEYRKVRNNLTCNSHNEEYDKALNEFGINEDTSLPEVASILFSSLFDLLDIDCLDSSQLLPITDLFLSEIVQHIESGNWDWKGERFNFSSVLFDDELKGHLECILLHENVNFSEKAANTLSQIIVSSSTRINVDGAIQTTYHIDSIESFLVLDLIKYQSSEKNVIRCQNPDCRRLFYPNSKKVKYCQLGHIDSKLACPEIMRRKSKDEFEEEMKKAMRIQDRCIRDAEYNKGHDYDYVELESIYRKWRYECIEQRDYYRSISDLEGFKKWIADTKLSPAHLEEMGIRKPTKTKKSRG